jgi:hypothetical protein
MKKINKIIKFIGLSGLISISCLGMEQKTDSKSPTIAQNNNRVYTVTSLHSLIHTLEFLKNEGYISYDFKIKEGTNLTFVVPQKIYESNNAFRSILLTIKNKNTSGIFIETNQKI